MKIQLPCDWKTIDIWNEKDPNMIGEALNHYCFIGHNGQRGCYEIFELPDYFDIVLKGEYYNQAQKEVCGEGDTFHCYMYELLEDDVTKLLNIGLITMVVAWQWDGDGCLYFRIKNDKQDIEVINNDCKCDYTWEFVK